MLIQADARGLPSIRIEKVGLQRASAGFPLDDVIVHGVSVHGKPVTLEIQVKRTVTFSAGDTVFADVVSQIAESVDKGALNDPEHRFAVAIARRSAKIDGTYQDLLTWARQLTCTDFFARIANEGEANDDARRFVATFRDRLSNPGNPVSDDLLWTIMRRFQILACDFGVPGSADTALSVERTTRALDPRSPGNAATLWEWLGTRALDAAAAGGGEITDNKLLSALSATNQFLLAGSRDFAAAGAALAEMTRHALEDIGREIAGVFLPRQDLTNAVHAAMDEGRYIEVRGGAGVGKSAVLRHFAEQVESASHLIVLTPNRTIGPGWTALRAALSVPGTAKEFLSELAVRGGGLLLIDNLDFFSGNSEKATVVDLVREAATIAGFRVIVTARREYGVDEPSWIPIDAVTRLVAAPPVMVGDLEETDIETLRKLAPQLNSLLADTHPAKAIVRNPYRLSRLAAVPGQKQTFRSEIDMAEEWWRTGDGPLEVRRERKRILAELADASLEGKGWIDARNHDTGPIDALVKREAVIEIASDRLSFRHDVLREWAGAARLHETGTLQGLATSAPLPSSFARTMELAARWALEKSPDANQWGNMLGFLDANQAHVSWRRPAILAIARSEVSSNLLEKAKDKLFAHDGALLRETIRTALAIEAVDGRPSLAAAGFDVALLDGPFFFPSNATWGRLIAFALHNSARLPTGALDDVLALFERFSTATLGTTPHTQAIVHQVFEWLRIVDAETAAPFERNQPAGLTTSMNWGELYGFRATLRRILASFATSDPQIARQYLRDLIEQDSPEEAIKAVMHYRGKLAEAAPKELVDLTLRGLVPARARNRRHGPAEDDEAVAYLDSDFLPCSPAQGPFLELLLAAPNEGLRLIRELVAHVIEERSGSADPGFNGYRIMLPEGERFFPWVESYSLARPYSTPFSVTCALMALEGWGHRRIEAGEDMRTVIADVLGPPGTCAAYLLVAIDLILSHWPLTRDAAVPFLGCTALLCDDRQRQVYDSIPQVDLLGWGKLEPDEPLGLVQLPALQGRPSRRTSLEDLLGFFALGAKDDAYALLRTLQENEMTRLGPPDAEATFADRTLMALHGFNATDPANYRRHAGGWIFQPPGQEAIAAARLDAQHAPRALETQLEQALGVALDQPGSCELAEKAVSYGQANMDALGARDDDDRWMQGQTVWSAALVAARDGSFELVNEHETWIRSVFDEALGQATDPVHSVRTGIRFNPLAIAAAGITYLWIRLGRDEDRRRLLMLAASSNPASAHGFARICSVLAKKDPRLPAAILRCGLGSAISPAIKFDQNPERRAQGEAEQAKRILRVIDAEIAWLDGGSNEPAWPQLPMPGSRLRRPAPIGSGTSPGLINGAKEGAGPATSWFNAQVGALWLKSVAAKVPVDQTLIHQTLVSQYADWTARANGLGLDTDSDLSDAPDEWSATYYHLMPRAVRAMGSTASRAFFEQVIALPDRHFFDAALEILLGIDQAYFGHKAIDQAEVQWVRQAFAARLLGCTAWRQAGNEISYSIERHFGPAVAAMMFNEYTFLNPPTCYLLEAAIDRADALLPTIQPMFGTGPVFMILTTMLNLFEVRPSPAHETYLIDLMLRTLKLTEGNAEFWVDHLLGQRCVALFDAYIDIDPSIAANPALPGILASLIRAGVPQAVALEVRIAG